jgi:hypothetical protein
MARGLKTLTPPPTAALNAYVLTDGNLKFKALLRKRTGALVKLPKAKSA